jgi:hypothetical protein
MMDARERSDRIVGRETPAPLTRYGEVIRRLNSPGCELLEPPAFMMQMR